MNANELSVPRGLNVDLMTTKEEAVAVFKLLTWAQGDLLFALGDWMKFSAERFGKEFVNEQLEFAGFSFSDCSKAYEVATRIPREKRSRALSFEHHAVAARAEQPEFALAWANDEGLTPAELAHAVRAKVRLTKAEIASQRQTAGFVSPSFIAQRFRVWRDRVPADSWTPEDKRAIFEELRPLREFLDQLEADLQESQKKLP